MTSAIILTWNSEGHIESTVHALQASAGFAREPLEIFIVDNGSADSTVEKIKSLQASVPNITLIQFSENKGTTYSRNVAIEKAAGEYILILDSDVDMEKEALSALLEKLKEKKEAGIVCPKLVYADGSTQFSYKRFPTVKIKFLKPLGSKLPFLARVAAQEELYEEQSGEIYPDYAISACWLVRKEVFDTIGLLDENIFYAPEDVEFCLRTWLGGFWILYVPTAVAAHYTRRLSYSDKKIAASHIKGLFYFFKKYKYWFSRKLLYQKIAYAIGREYPIAP